jgi:DNA mismatch endonuclease (patch repair protein)
MDKYTAHVRSRMMAAVRSRGNRTTERRLRACMIRAGLKGWSVQPPDVAGRPDFVFTEQRLAIFVDGAFWHGAPGFNRFPKSRLEYWKPKIERNKLRDASVNRKLRAAGWSVLRFWDHELEQNPRAVVRTIEDRLRARALP